MFVRHRMIKCLTFLALLAQTGSAAQHSHIPNLALVEPGIWRGGQPDAEGWRQLKLLGVTNVVKLNLEMEGSDQRAEELGLRVNRVPICLARQLFKGPSNRQIQKATSAICPGTYVHCQHGEDRTGLMIACWRMQSAGEAFSKEKAEADMLANGFHRSLGGLWGAWEHFRPPRSVRAFKSPTAISEQWE
jgi:hypothetical protein